MQSYCIEWTSSIAFGLSTSEWNCSLPKSKILGIPFNSLSFACLITLVMQFRNARKIDFPTSEADKASIQGKKINFKSNGYESKKTYKGARRAVWHLPFPLFPLDRQCEMHEKPLLWQGCIVGTLWWLYLQRDKRTEYLWTSKIVLIWQTDWLRLS